MTRHELQRDAAIVRSLERIATAAERIADALDGEKAGERLTVQDQIARAVAEVKR